MDLGPGSVLGTKYRLVRPLARGGQGSVWVAHHLGLDVPIAIKFLTDTGPDEKKARSRFEREARAAASIRSPHVVQVLDYDANGELPYIVMELLQGEDLRKRLARRRRLPLGELSAIVTQLGKGLTLAHKAGIVHRDLKPSNVFITRVGTDEIVKVLDFGVAKETVLDVAQTDTTTGLVVGSPSYMSPEQARGARIDGRSDLWSLAVLLFQAMTGKRPFDGQNLGDLLVRICSEQIPLPTQVAPDLPPAIDAFMVQALSRNPDERFQTGTEFADAFVAIAGPPVAAPQDAAMEDATEDSAPRERPLGMGEQIADGAGPTVIHARSSSGTSPRASVTDVSRTRPTSPAEQVALESGTHAGAAVALPSSGRPAPAPKRRGVLGPVLAIGFVAALVVGGWFAWHSGLIRIGRDASASTPVVSTPTATAAAIATGTASAAAAATPTSAPETQSATATSAASPSAVVASAMAPTSAPTTAPTVAQPVRPHGQWPPAYAQPQRPVAADPGVDPKFGLPGGRH